MEMEIGHTLLLLKVSSFVSCSVLKDTSFAEMKNERKGENQRRVCNSDEEREQDRQSVVG